MSSHINPSVRFISSFYAPGAFYISNPESPERVLIPEGFFCCKLEFAWCDFLWAIWCSSTCFVSMISVRRAQILENRGNFISPSQRSTWLPPAPTFNWPQSLGSPCRPTAGLSMRKRRQTVSMQSAVGKQKGLRKSSSDRSQAGSCQACQSSWGGGWAKYCSLSLGVKTQDSFLSTWASNLSNWV